MYAFMDHCYYWLDWSCNNRYNYIEQIVTQILIKWRYGLGLNSTFSRFEKVSSENKQISIVIPEVWSHRVFTKWIQQRHNRNTYFMILEHKYLNIIKKIKCVEGCVEFRKFCTFISTCTCCLGRTLNNPMSNARRWLSYMHCRVTPLTIN